VAFIDEIELEVRAGRGGDGVVRWLHLKGKEYSGPAGGNGGDGGNVYIHGVRNIDLLAHYRGTKKFYAEDGAAGGNQNKAGKSGADITIDLPVGSIVRNQTTGEVFELLHEDQTQLILKGGRGGAGNAVFKSSVNQRPTESTPGLSGEEAMLHIELRLIADAGLIGLPNAGKTSLLNALTRAEGKVGSYAFTTLDPNLGELYGFILADIPGLIEGASTGKGLGIQFLRHVSRTKLLIHCVSIESEDPLRDYQTVRTELQSFENGELQHKPEMLVLTKSDTRTLAELQTIAAQFKKEHENIEIVSVLDDESLKQLSDGITRRLRVL
jgi:GTP-binding protein